MSEVGRVEEMPDPFLPRDDSEWCDDEDGGAPDPPVTAELVLQQLGGHQRLAQFVACQQLVSVVQWARLHPGAVDPSPAQVAGAERAVQLGGDGTPLVAEFAGAELAVATHSTTFAADRLIADALDLCHRFPLLWERICGSEVEAWQARRIAQHTRHLSRDAAARVDADLADVVGTVAWGRLEALLVGRTIAADPVAAAAAASAAQQARFVRKGRANPDGVTGVYARMDAAEALWLDATLTLLADLLATHRGNTDPMDVRRAAALGLLGRPVDALALLAEQARSEPETASEVPSSAPPAAPVPDPADRFATVLREEPWDLAAYPTTESAVPWVPRSHPDFHPDPTPPDNLVEPDNDDLERHHPLAPLTTRNTVEVEQLINALADPKVREQMRPRSVVHVHVAAETLAESDRPNGAVRSDLGPQVASLVKDWLGQTQVKTLPVIDLPAGELPVDSYEIPTRMRRHLSERVSGSMFPWSGSMAGLDLDHTRPYDHGEADRPPPRQQTRLANLAPHSRREHRILTHHEGWERRQPGLGVLVLCTPHGRVLLTSSSHGTHDLGAGSLARAIWAVVR